MFFSNLIVFVALYYYTINYTTVKRKSYNGVQKRCRGALNCYFYLFVC